MWRWCRFTLWLDRWVDCTDEWTAQMSELDRWVDCTGEWTGQVSAGQIWTPGHVLLCQSAETRWMKVWEEKRSERVLLFCPSVWRRAFQPEFQRGRSEQPWLDSALYAVCFILFLQSDVSSHLQRKTCTVNSERRELKLPYCCTLPFFHRHNKSPSNSQYSKVNCDYCLSTEVFLIWNYISCKAVSAFCTMLLFLHVLGGRSFDGFPVWSKISHLFSLYVFNFC